MYQYICMYGTLTHWIKIDLCIRFRKTGDCIAVTTVKESKDLPCDPRVQEVKLVYLFFLLVTFKNATFLLLVAGTWGQEEARRGKRKMALITGKGCQQELVVTIAKTIQLTLWYMFFLAFSFFSLLILVHHF